MVRRVRSEPRVKRQGGRLDEPLKQRLVGAAVLAALAILVLPLMLDDSGPNRTAITDSNIPPMPADQFSSRIVPLDTEPPPLVEGTDEPAGEDGGDAAGGRSDDAGAAGADVEAHPEAGGPRVGVTAWVVQLGSFAAHDNALQLEKRLKDAGYSAFVEQVDTDRGTVYRVRVGPELLRGEAQAVRDRLAQEVGLEGIVVRYP